MYNLWIKRLCDQVEKFQKDFLSIIRHNFSDYYPEEKILSHSSGSKYQHSHF